VRGQGKRAPSRGFRPLANSPGDFPQEIHIDNTLIGLKSERLSQLRPAGLADSNRTAIHLG
jgi:hypothetical protein